MEKPKTYTSPFGKAIYPHLTKADVKWKPEGEFHVDLEVDADKSLELVTLIDKHVEKALTEEKKKGKKKELASFCISDSSLIFLLEASLSFSKNRSSPLEEGPSSLQINVR